MPSVPSRSALLFHHLRPHNLPIRPSSSPSRSLNTSSTAYPSGSVKHPTTIIPSTLATRSPNPYHPSRLLPPSHRTLPDLPNRKPLYAGCFAVLASVWGAFIYFSTNAEKANSSVVRAVLFELRTNPLTRMALGEPITPERDDAFGQLWVDGQINLMQGSVDVAFRVRGSQNAGKVYFTSVRRDRQSDFEIIRWRLIRDDGAVLDLAKEPRSVLFVADDSSARITSTHVLADNLKGTTDAQQDLSTERLV